MGPLEVEREGQLLDIRGSKRRAVFAMLALHANEVVRTDRLIEDLWGARPPTNAQAALQNHVFRLRKDIGGDVLVTKPWGYVLRIEPEAIDLRRSERLVSESRSLPAQERSAALAEALALWRGPPLADLAQEEGLAHEVERLEELRLAALEERVDADLELGRHADLVRELEALVALCPLRERLRGQLILALYRSGRQAEALETYRETRRVLVEELGIEPSPELKELERAILRQDPALAVAPVPPPEPDLRPERSRWRWPRSPLGIAAALALVALAGVLTAAILARSDRETPVATPTTSPSTTVSTEKPSTSEPPPTLTTTRTQPSSTTTTVIQPVLTTTQPEPPTTTEPPTTVERTTVEQTTTTATTPKPPVPVPVFDYVLADDFENPAFDNGMWHVASHGAGVDIAEQNGRLEFLVAPEVSYEGIYGFDRHYGTGCLLTGDFDARVEFELLDWPANDGMALVFGAYFPSRLDTDFAYIERHGAPSTGGTESYGSPLGTRNSVVQTADMTGALRLKRTKGVLTSYYRHDGQWVRLASGSGRGPTNLILSFASNQPQFGGQPARAAFDNFRATAESVDCTGYPLPPRSRRT